ncbi:response regulator [Spirochaeta lutea]|uniref:Chemotaxis protein CheY n=1 Tax=Spirochaeta lutea TaxID=1480694 RepID=A0A098R1M2_9SPIO|nr:response regulator [Spirochaeta lutea]KGE73844.1 chemotaxis protein CheY [Spirochaeta lutea]
MKVLVAEDDFGSRKVISTLLREIPGVVLDLVVDGNEALEAFKLAWQEKKPYNLILMDIMMPGLDGQEALVQIRDVEKTMGLRQKDEVRAIMVTALEDPSNVIQAFNKGGATGYLIKPIQRDSLFEEIRKAGFDI